MKNEKENCQLKLDSNYTWRDMDRDPHTRIITTSYIFLVDSSTLNVKTSDEANDAKWMKVSCK